MDKLIIPAWMRVMKEVSIHPEISHSNIAKNLNVTYSHVCGVIDLLVEKKLIETSRTGRTNKVVLTTNGKVLAIELEGILNKVKKLEG